MFDNNYIISKNVEEKFNINKIILSCDMEKMDELNELGILKHYNNELLYNLSTMIETDDITKEFIACLKYLFSKCRNISNNNAVSNILLRQGYECLYNYYFDFVNNMSNIPTMKIIGLIKYPLKDNDLKIKVIESCIKKGYIPINTGVAVMLKQLNNEVLNKYI